MLGRRNWERDLFLLVDASKKTFLKSHSKTSGNFRTFEEDGMASEVHWAQDIKGKESIDSVIQHINEISSNQNHPNRMILVMGDVLQMTKSTFDDPNEFQSQSEEHLLQHPVELCIGIYRKHCSKNPPFCNSIYGLTDQLISLQLVMAQKNKEDSGEFEVDSHDVILAHELLTQTKLFGLSTNDDERQHLIEDYNKFLAHCNAVDYADIIKSVRQCFKSSDNNVQELYQNQNYIILGFPKTIIEIEILMLLIGERDIILFSPGQEGSKLTNEKFKETLKNRCDSNKSLCQEVSGMPSTPMHQPNKTQTDCHVTPQHLTGTNDRQVSKCVTGGLSPALSQSSFSQGRRTMGHELSVLMSYLQLLVNSRDELALARVINIPDRELGVRKFTKIKRMAREKNMPMYQMVTSFILQIRLGGKSYAPSTDNPLWLMTKGLSDFVSFFQKLQNVLEEVADAKIAVLKMIGNLQSTLIRSNDGALCNEDVRKATSYLKTQIDHALNSNKQEDSKGGEKPSMIGSESYLLLRKLLDKNVLYDYQEKELHSALITPYRKKGKTCSLLTKFRTPEGPTPKKEEIKSNQHACNNEETAKVQGRQERSVYGDMSWAKPAVNIGRRTSIWQNNEDNVMNQEHQTRKPFEIFNAETPKSSSRKRTFGDSCCSLRGKTSSPQRKRPYESQDDQENIITNDQGSEGLLTKPTAKRGLLSYKEKELGKKKKAPKAADSLSKKKQKAVKLTQGQKQMTHFFR